MLETSDDTEVPLEGTGREGGREGEGGRLVGSESTMSNGELLLTGTGQRPVQVSDSYIPGKLWDCTGFPSLFMSFLPAFCLRVLSVTARVYRRFAPGRRAGRARVIASPVSAAARRSTRTRAWGTGAAAACDASR